MGFKDSLILAINNEATILSLDDEFDVGREFDNLEQLKEFGDFVAPKRITITYVAR